MKEMTTESKTKPRSNAAIDVAKYIFSLLILSLHAGVDLGVLTPIYRIPVPCFFLFTSFFLFSKMAHVEDESARQKILKDFLIRNLKLYLFWFIVQSPLILKNFFGDPEGGLLRCMLIFLRSLFFGSTFGASWYITATLINCLLVYWLSSKLEPKLLLIGGILVYLGCLMFSNYYGLIKWCLPLRYAFTAFNALFNSVVNGFPAGFLWVVLGKLLAERPYSMKKGYYWVMVLGFLGLIAEHILVNRFDLVLVNDCYLMLIPTYVALFQMLRGFSWTYTQSLKLRNMSTIIYTFHRAIQGQIFSMIQSCSALGCAIGSMLIITVLSMIIFKLERFKPLAWLRYSH